MKLIWWQNGFIDLGCETNGVSDLVTNGLMDVGCEMILELN